MIEHNRAHWIWSYHAPIIIHSLISDCRDSISFSWSRLYDFRNRGYTSPKNTMTANRITKVGRNMKIKRKRLNPRVRFCPRANRRAMISRAEYIQSIWARKERFEWKWSHCDRPGRACYPIYTYSYSDTTMEAPDVRPQHCGSWNRF